jgi:hypothetical protein
MTFGRLSTALPLAALTAVLVHVAANGFDHVPGLGQAPRLAAVLGASLALAALLTFLGAVLAPRQRSIATKGADAAFLAAVGAGGFGFYLAIECSEGHGLASALLPALLVCLPLAALVYHAARAVAGVLRAAGTALARYAADTSGTGSDGFARVFEQRSRPRPAATPRGHRGRAPPQPA